MEVISSREEPFLKKITGIITENLSDDGFGAEELVSKSGMTRYKLSKKLRLATGKNINQFIRETRLRKAFEMLRDGSATASEVAYKTGFSSPAYFNKCFHDLYGYTPGHIETEDVGSPTQITIEKKLQYRTRLSISVLLAVATICGFLYFAGVFNNENGSSGKPGIAVMPFENLTGNPEWDFRGRAIQRDLISALALTGELGVRGESSIDSLMKRSGVIESSVSFPSAMVISKKLQTEYFINGSLQKFEQQVRIDAHIIETSSGIVKKSFEVTGIYYDDNTILSMIDSLREQITNHLLVANIIKKNNYYQHLFTSSRSFTAMKYYDIAVKTTDNVEKIEYLKKALEEDSTFYRAALALESAYSDYKTDSSRIWLIRNFNNRFKMSEQERLDASWAYSFTFESPGEQINYLTQLIETDDEEPSNQYLLGLTYCLNKDFVKAVPQIEASLKILQRWGDEFLKDNYGVFKWLGIAYHNLGQYRKEKRLYSKSEKYIKDNPVFELMNSLVAINENDSARFNYHIKRFSDHYREIDTTEAEIMRMIGRYFKHTHQYDISEKYLKKSLSLDPKNTKILEEFADFCRQSERYNYPEILETAIRLAPDKQSYCEFLALKGMNLYAQGKKTEGRNLIETAWNEAPFKIYNLKVFMRKTEF